jgi:predicted restriction endonuclease
MKAELSRKCAICGYDLHIDICHIKPIKDFPDDAYIADINNTTNLIALCKNHHWELDHGLLILPT